MSRPKHYRPTRIKLRKIRAILREREADAQSIATEVGISYAYAHDLLTRLKKSGQVRVAYTQRVTSGPNPRNVYALTDGYLSSINGDQHKAQDERSQTVTPVQQPRKPWYRRAIDWLTGDAHLTYRG